MISFWFLLSGGRWSASILHQMSSLLRKGSRACSSSFLNSQPIQWTGILARIKLSLDMGACRFGTKNIFEYSLLTKGSTPQPPPIKKMLLIKNENLIIPCYWEKHRGGNLSTLGESSKSLQLLFLPCCCCRCLIYIQILHRTRQRTITVQNSREIVGEAITKSPTEFIPK